MIIKMEEYAFLLFEFYVSSCGVKYGKIAVMKMMPMKEFRKKSLCLRKQEKSDK
jgi:hypothetical protein